MNTQLHNLKLLLPRWMVLPRAHCSACAGIALLAVGAGPALAATRYVSLNSVAPAPPFTTWATAATNIQDAIDAALDGDEVLVTNGMYATGGRVACGTMTNRVAVTKALTVRSVNGPETTVIEGFQVPTHSLGFGSAAIRCVYLTNGARLAGFTLTNGGVSYGTIEDTAGGGVLAESGAVVSNCIFVGNKAGNGGGLSGGRAESCVFRENHGYHRGGGASYATLYDSLLIRNYTHESEDGGGGAYDCTLIRCVVRENFSSDDGDSNAYGGGVCRSRLLNCLLTGNQASHTHRGVGGGAYASCLTNCTVASNTAYHGGGVYGSVVVNCIVSGNYGNGSANHDALSLALFTCTTPIPTNGVGNLTNAPLFVDAATGDFRLRPGSPGIEAGTSLGAILANDLDGHPRPLDGNGDGVAAFDMGAYESGMVWPPYSRLALQRIATFGLDDDGSSPRSLIEGRDGCLYGTTSGSLNTLHATNAMVFKLTCSGTVTVLTSFAPGDVPEGLVEAADGNFYCATRRYDPPGSCGSIVRVAPTGERTNIFNFHGTNGCFADNLIADSDENLYGLVFSTAGDLSAFKLTQSGEFTLLRNNVGRLLLGEDGFLYGTDASGLNVFRLTTDGAATVLATAPNGIRSFRALVDGGDGHLYGFARRGFEGKDSVFRLTRSGILTELLLFNGPNGLYPTVLGAGVDGNLYGLTEAGGPDWGGMHSPGSGVIFQVTPDGTLTTLAHSFPTGPGIELEGMLQGIDGNLYLAPEGADLGLPGIYRLAPRPVLTRVQHAAGRDVVTWSAFAGGAYQLEHKPTLATTNWNALPAIHASAATTTITNDVGAAAQGYYRIRLLP